MVNPSSIDKEFRKKRKTFLCKWNYFSIFAQHLFKKMMHNNLNSNGLYLICCGLVKSLDTQQEMLSISKSSNGCGLVKSLDTQQGKKNIDYEVRCCGLVKSLDTQQICFNREQP